MKFNKVTKCLAWAFGLIAYGVHSFEVTTDEIEKIVVTGQKIDRTIQDTPISVAVLTSKDIEQHNVQNVADIYNYAPNISGNFGQGFSIRGINAFNVSGGGNSYLTSMYLDGAPLPYRVIRSGAVSVWDLSQVEIFRGPQSTLQGRNALAGAIMLRTQDPTYEWSGKGRVVIGEYGQQEFAVATGGAIIDNNLAFRLSAEDKNYDGDIYNTTRNEESNYEDSKTYRAKLLFEPNDDIRALLTVSTAESEVGPQWSLFKNDSSPFDRETNYNSHIWTRTDTDIYNLEVSWALSDDLSLDLVSTYSDSDYGYNWDGDMQPEQITADNEYRRNDKTTSHEIRLTYDTDELQLVGGVYWSALEVEDLSSGERLLPFSDMGLPPLPALLMAPQEMGGFGLSQEVAAMIIPLYPDIDPVKLGMSAALEQEVDTSAIYLDATWTISDKWDLLAGLRYDKEEQTNASVSNYTINNEMPDPALIPAPLNQVVAIINGTLNGLAANASGEEPASKADFDAWLPKLGFSYHINEDISTSIIYQKGYRSGGVGANIGQSRIYTYDPEYTDNYEISFRSVWQQGQLVFNANAFYTDWTDQQISMQLSTANFDIETVNAGESNIKGFELELFYYPSEQLSIVAGLGLAKSEFTKFEYVIQSNGELKDLSGRPFADSPEWTANIAANYDFGNGLTAGASVNYMGSSVAYLDPVITLEAAKYAIDSDPKNDARTLVNAHLAYNWEQFTVRLDARNLFDEEYTSTYFFESDDLNRVDSYGQQQIGRPRQVSLSLLAEF